MLEMAMRFAGIESEGDVENIFRVIKNLERFVSPSHQLIACLKMKILDEIVAAKQVPDVEILKKGVESCIELLKVCPAIAPGQSRLLGR